MGSHLIVSAAPREHKPYVKRVRFVDEDRVASLRARVTHDIPRPTYRDKRAWTRSQAREEASRAVIRRARPPRARVGGGNRGGAGGWNAGPYVGTALVVQASRRHSAATSSRRIAIRQRPDGRLYGYFGRTQIAFRHGAMNLPVTLSGVTVLSYEDGGKLEEE